MEERSSIHETICRYFNWRKINVTILPWFEIFFYSKGEFREQYSYKRDNDVKFCWMTCVFFQNILACRQRNHHVFSPARASAYFKQFLSLLLKKSFQRPLKNIKCGSVEHCRNLDPGYSCECNEGTIRKLFNDKFNYKITFTNRNFVSTNPTDWKIHFTAKKYLILLY